MIGKCASGGKRKVAAAGSGLKTIIKCCVPSQIMDEKLFRVIDANANRAREGLRVAEEVCRLVLGDEKLTSRWKSLRHEVTALLRELPPDKMIEQRESVNDVGRELATVQEKTRAGYGDLVMVNARRAEEGMRVLEEFCKLVVPEVGMKFKNLRFLAYSLEKDTLSRVGKAGEREG